MESQQLTIRKSRAGPCRCGSKGSRHRSSVGKLPGYRCLGLLLAAPGRHVAGFLYDGSGAFHAAPGKTGLGPSDDAAFNAHL